MLIYTSMIWFFIVESSFHEMIFEYRKNAPGNGSYLEYSSIINADYTSQAKDEFL